MRTSSLIAGLTVAAPLVSAATCPADPIFTDISVISRLWGFISTYGDNADDAFGVQDVGLPDGCQVESVQLLQRHAQRFPTSGDDDGTNDQRFAAKVKNYTMEAGAGKFSGPLAFLNSYEYILSSGLLTGIGAASEVAAGVQFWNKYGRTLYNAAPGQLSYNATGQTPPVLRTTSQSRIYNSEINWALGFFGTSFQATPNPTLTGANSAFSLVVIPEGGTENNTLASYDGCANDNLDSIGYIGDNNLFTYIPKYLSAATARMNMYAPSGFTFTLNDTYAMQGICAYETGYIGQSDFCKLFTLKEWEGFENTLDIEYYDDYAWGNPTGRAQGIGYVQEVLARLQHQEIFIGNSSVNTTFDNNPTSFPVNQKFYADFSHDDIIISTLTALSMDYFKQQPSLSQVPPDPKRPFFLSHLTPFGARLVTEQIGCTSANPDTVSNARTQYYPGQYGYSASSATNKFIRMRLNNGILPIASIRGGYCAGRTDGLCPLSQFIKSQQPSMGLANYQYACFGNYSVSQYPEGYDFDGTIFPPK